MRLRIKGITAAPAAMLFSLLLPLVSFGQTAISAPKNKYQVQDDIKLGRDASTEVERTFPLLDDQEANRYVTRIGERLVAAIPPQFQQPAFYYRFKVVNASDINAFALPGGPMYVNRGMFEAAKNEGEVAGVMAHEISHVALRHSTAQATKNSSAGSTLRNLGLILGGAVVGGEAGAQLGSVFAAGFTLKNSREYETQADILGAQIMARAGYDPRDLANMFRTIEQTSGSGGPQWLSDHPNPGNRYDAINREAANLRVSPNPIQRTQEFLAIQERFQRLPRARTMAEIQRDAQNGRGPINNTSSNARYSDSVPYPSSSYRQFTSGNWIRLNVPSNWEEISGNSEVQFAPSGAYGDQGITHGVMIGLFKGGSRSLNSDSDTYIQGILRDNPYLRQQGTASYATIGGRQARTVTLAGRSPVTRRNEVVTIYTTSLRNGDLFYAATVSPEDQTVSYNNTFRSVINSIRLTD